MRRRELMLLLLAGAMAAARTLRAQPKGLPVIGFFSTTSLGADGPFMAAFRQGLSEAGFVEGQNVVVQYRSAEGRYDTLPALAADLVSRKVDVIVTAEQRLGAGQNDTCSVSICSTGAEAGENCSAPTIMRIDHPLARARQREIAAGKSDGLSRAGYHETNENGVLSGLPKCWASLQVVISATNRLLIIPLFNRVTHRFRG